MSVSLSLSLSLSLSPSPFLSLYLCLSVSLSLFLSPHITTQAPNSLPTWTTSTCGSNHSTFYRQSLSSQQPPDLLYSPPRHKCGKPLAMTPFHLSSKTRSHSHSTAWEDIYKSMETLSPAPVVLGEQATMEKTTQGFQKITTTLADPKRRGTQLRRQ